MEMQGKNGHLEHDTQGVNRGQPPLRYESKRHWGCWGCFFLVVLFVFFWVAGIGYLVARTGLYEIPIMSSLVFDPVSPTREIDITEEEAIELVAGLDDTFIETVEEEVSRGNDTSAVDIEIEITEEEMTAELLVSYQSLDLEESGLSLDTPQIVITKNFIEIYADIAGEHPSVVLMEVFPELVSGSVEITLKRVVIGNLRIPNPAVNYLVDQYVEDNINRFLTESISEQTQVRSIELADRKIILHLTVVPE